MAHRITSDQLVGRADALERLLAPVREPAASRVRHLIVSGEAGVGKTRLLTRARELATEAGARVLLGGCVSMGEARLPFAPYAEVVRDLVAQHGAAQTASMAGWGTSELARLVPSLGAPDAAMPQQASAQSRLHEALLDLLRRLATDGPLMVQLEDLHWADAGTLAATEFLFRAIRDEPISIVCTVRSDEVTRRHPLRAWLAETGRSDRIDRLDLEPLDPEETAELVHSITGWDRSIAAVHDIHRRSDGNPFYIEELLASGADPNRPLPASLREVLLARVDRLASSAQRLLAIAAVDGREVDHEMLLGVADRSEVDAGDDLASLIEAGLLVPRSTSASDGYTFRHALLQEAVLDTVIPPERRRLHSQYAARLEARGDSTSRDASLLVSLAHHWREARDERALDASIRAGDAAMGSAAFSTAASEFDLALDLWQDTTPDRDGDLDHVALLTRAARAAYYDSDYRRAAAVAREATEELDDDADSSRRTELGLVLGRALWQSGDWSASLEVYEQALAGAPPAPHLARIHALTGLAHGYMLLGWLTRSRPLAEEAIELARSADAPELVAHGLSTLSIDLAGMGEGDAAVDAIEAALGIAERLHLPDEIGRAHINRSDVLNWLGRTRQALESVDVGTAVVAEGLVSIPTYLRYNGVLYAYLIGEWDRAAELLAAGDRRADSSVGTEAYRAEYALGFLVSSGAAEAEERWKRARQMRSEHPYSATSTTAFTAAIEAACYDDRFDEAREIAEECLRLLLEIDGYNRVPDLVRIAAWPLVEIGRQALSTDRPEVFEGAQERLDALIALVRRSKERLGSQPGALGQLLAANEAHVAMERQRMVGRETLDGWNSVAAGWHQTERPFYEAYALWRAAEAADATGDRDAAVAALRSSHAIVLRLGAKPLLGKLEVFARKLRLRLTGNGPAAGASGDPSAYGLTPRELEVLTLVVAGRTNRQIASELFISQSTAGVHVSNILSKLGVSSRTEAASLALRQGFGGS